MNLYLRKVEKNDMDLLFNWANDDTVRQNAFNQEKIPYENHVDWFRRMLEREDVHMYIMCNEENIPIGQIRLNIENNNAIIDYSIASEIRGMGFGADMIWLAKEKIENEGLRVNKLIGQVKYGNNASARVFEKCGFLKQDKEKYMEYFIEL